MNFLWGELYYDSLSTSALHAVSSQKNTFSLLASVRYCSIQPFSRTVFSPPFYRTWPEWERRKKENVPSSSWIVLIYSLSSRSLAYRKRYYNATSPSYRLISTYIAKWTDTLIWDFKWNFNGHEIFKSQVRNNSS